MQKRIIGLTGPTGAGKSVAAGVFADLGCTVVDCDQIAREIVRDPATLQNLAEAFGKEILREDGTLNRRELAARAFASREKELLLNKITHPPIMQKVREAIRVSNTEAVILDAPLLFESGADALCSCTVAVLARTETRCARIMERDGLTEEEAMRRISAQQPDSYYRSRAKIIMENDGEPDAFCQMAEQWLKKFLHQQEDL